MGCPLEFAVRIVNVDHSLQLVLVADRECAELIVDYITRHGGKLEKMKIDMQGTRTIMVYRIGKKRITLDFVEDLSLLSVEATLV